jgi:Spy/CpxP family protein refolding chaperone
MEKQNGNPEKRRRFFRRAAIATLIGGVAAGIGVTAFAHGPGGGWHRGGFAAGPLDPGGVEEHLERMLKHLYVEIDATDAQKQQLDPIVKQAASDLRPLRERVRGARRRGAELFSADTIDRGAIERARVEQIGAADAASKRFTQALTDVAEVLTPEQRKKLAARLARRGHGRRGPMFG